MGMPLAEDIKQSIRAIHDFPKKGVLFRDITPLLLDGAKFKRCIDWFAALHPVRPDYVISIESRGFIFGSALACQIGAGFVPIRKAGKLPHQTLSTTCKLEYGEAVLEIHADAMEKGNTAIIIDDVLATGGTIEAALGLARRLGVDTLGVCFLIELEGLGGRSRLPGVPVHSLIRYS